MEWYPIIEIDLFKQKKSGEVVGRMNEKWPRVLIFCISIAAHLVAFLQFRLNVGGVMLPPQWRGQFLLLLFFSLAFAISLPLYRTKKYAVWAVLLVRAGILVLLGFPFGSYLGIELTLFGALIIETFAYTSLRFGLVFTILVTGVLITNQRPMMAWGMILPVATPHDRVSFAMFVAMLTTLSAMIRFQRDNQISSKELNRYLNEATLQLAQANLELQDYAVMAEQEAISNERKRLAREMHDTLAYTLTNLVMMLEASLDLSSGNREELLNHLRLARDQAKEGLVGVRSALQALRPVHLEEENGLTAIYHLIQTFTKATRIKVELNLGDAPLILGEEADWAAYRLVQEGMTNALRHGKATLIEISFYQERNGVRINIRDNGKGMENSSQGGFGLLGMRERIEKLGGELSANNQAGKGFVLSAWIPLKEG